MQNLPGHAGATFPRACSNCCSSATIRGSRCVQCYWLMMSVISAVHQRKLVSITSAAAVDNVDGLHCGKAPCENWQERCSGTVALLSNLCILLDHHIVAEPILLGIICEALNLPVSIPAITLIAVGHRFPCVQFLTLRCGTGNVACA